MMMLPYLPFCRQSSSAKRHLRVAISTLLKSFRHSGHTLPRMRLRSLDIIPHSLSLSRYTPSSTLTQALVPNLPLSAWDALWLGSPLADVLLPKLIACFSRASLPPRLPPLMTWNPSSLKTIQPHSQISPHPCLSYPGNSMVLPTI